MAKREAYDERLNLKERRICTDWRDGEIKMGKTYAGVQGD